MQQVSIEMEEKARQQRLLEQKLCIDTRVINSAGIRGEEHVSTEIFISWEWIGRDKEADRKM